MTDIVPGSDLLFFNHEEEIVDHLLRKILANKKRKIGTEWEMFFVDPKGKPVTRTAGQKAFGEFKRVFSLIGYDAEYIHEKAANGDETIFGLNIDGLGVITPEMGHQFEFACSVCENYDEIREKNEEAYRAIIEVARGLNYSPVFKGHIPGYAENSEGAYRSRSVQWQVYYDQLGSGAAPVREALGGTASVQVTMDCGAEKFHEFFRALLLIEPVFTLHYANSDRSYLWTKAYGRFIPSQVEPLTGVWDAQNPKEAVESIVKRLMGLYVPFLPDPERPCLYKAESFVENHSPTVSNLMEQGRLSEMVLNNTGGFFLARPALRKFPQALLEMRGVDSQSTPKKVAEIARRTMSLVYDDAAREGLLRDYSHLSQSDIKKLHDASTMMMKSEAMDIEIAGTKVGDIAKDVIARSDETQRLPAPSSLYTKSSAKDLLSPENSRVKIGDSAKFSLSDSAAPVSGD